MALGRVSAYSGESKVAATSKWELVVKLVVNGWEP